MTLLCMNEPRLKLSAKLCLGSGEKGYIGPGRVRLLKLVRELGSLRRAAQELNMSYRWAWDHVNAAEKALGCSLLVRTEKGKSGRPSELTQEARALVDWYDSVEERLRQALREEDRMIPAFLRPKAPAAKP